MIVLLALLAATAQAGQGLDATLASPVRGGAVELRLEATDEGVRRAIRIDAAEVVRLHAVGGTARPDRIAPTAPGGEGVVTIVAIDASGSFAPFLDPTYDVAGAYLDRRPLRERVGFLLFGVRRTDFPTELEDKNIRAQLARARATRGRQAETRLAEFVRQAAQRAAQEQPTSAGGIRQIILFTDGGEESRTWSVDEVADELIELDVRAHVVTFYRRGFGSRATALDNLSRLASRTGGVYVQASEAREASGRMGEIAGSSGNTLDVAATLCGFDSDHTELRAEAWMDGRRVAWSDAITLADLSDKVREPCVGGSGSTAGSGSTPGSGPADPSADSTSGPSVAQIIGWSCLPLGLLLLVAGLIVGVVAVARRRTTAEEPEPRPEPAPPAPPRRAATPVVRSAPANLLTAPGPVAAPVNAGPAATLRVIRGEGVQGRTFPFRGNTLLVGARPGNDVVVDLPTISGHHARFEIDQRGAIYVTDSDSANGTWVQGSRLSRGEKRPLRWGDRVALSQALVFELTPPESSE